MFDPEATIEETKAIAPKNSDIILLFSWAFAGRTNYDKSNWAKAVLLWSAGVSLISAVGTIFYIAWGYSRLGYFYY